LSNRHYGKQRRVVAYLDGLIERVNVLRAIKSAGGEELRRSWTVMPAVLDRVFKGELWPLMEEKWNS